MTKNFQKGLCLCGCIALWKTFFGCPCPHLDPADGRSVSGVKEPGRINFKNSSSDALSLNSTKTYSFFSSDSLSQDYKGELLITNKSKLYDYMITVKTVGVNVIKSKVEEEETTYTLNEYINISVVKWWNRNQFL